MTSPPSVSTKPNEVHLWVAIDDQCSRKELLGKYHQLLNQAEKERHQRFHFEKDRNQYLISRALMRTVFSLYAPQISAKQWCFTENKYGKPYIESNLIEVPLNFNLSHTQNMAVLAVTEKSEIGVDVEFILRDNNVMDIAKNFFSTEETKALFGLDKALQEARFFDLWTLKEAYIKACGMGLSIPLNSFSFHFPSEEQIAISFSPERNDHPTHWRFRQFDLFGTHKIAVAMQSYPKNRDNLTLCVNRVIPLEKLSTQVPINSFDLLKSSE